MQIILARVLVIGFLLMSFAGCERQGPAERAGERVDETIDDVGDSLEEAGDELDN